MCLYVKYIAFSKNPQLKALPGWENTTSPTTHSPHLIYTAKAVKMTNQSPKIIPIKSLPLLADKIQAFRGDLTLILKSSYTSVDQMFCPSSTLVKRHILLA